MTPQDFDDLVQTVALELLEKLREKQRRVVPRAVGKFALRREYRVGWKLAIGVDDMHDRAFWLATTHSTFAALVGGLWQQLRPAEVAVRSSAHDRFARWYHDLSELVVGRQRTELELELLALQAAIRAGQEVDLVEHLVQLLKAPHPACDEVPARIRRAPLVIAGGA